MEFALFLIHVPTPICTQHTEALNTNFKFARRPTLICDFFLFAKIGEQR